MGVTEMDLVVHIPWYGQTLGFLKHGRERIANRL